MSDINEKATESTAPVAGTAQPKAVEKAPGRFDKTFEEERETKHASVPMDQIELKAEDLYDKDKVDLEQVEMEDIWTLLQ